MKFARKRWLRGIAACVLMAGPAWAQGVGSIGQPVPYDPSNAEGTVIITDQSHGGDPQADVSASVSELPPSPQPYGISPDQVLGEAPPVFDDAMVPYSDNVGYASTTSVDQIFWRAGRVNIDQYGINGGYTNLNAFIPVTIENDRALWFFNPRVNIADGGEGGVSLGVGRRDYIPELDRVFGASFWWDYDAAHRGTYNQLGGSFESIGRYFSLRSNFSIPIGNSYTDYAVTMGTPQFQGNQIAVQQIFSREQAYQQYDFEAETPFPGLAPYGVDFGLGGYYLAAPDAGDSFGLSVRAQAQVTEDLWINTVLTNDNVFDTQVSVNLELTMPNGRPARWFRRNAVTHYLTESVRRRYRVPVANITKPTTSIVNGPNGDPINIAFIDPNRLTSGDGSPTNPFMSVEEYMSLAVADREIFDVIFVRRRDDLTDINLNTTITLLDFQRLIGDGDLPDGSRPSITTSLGVIELPGTTGPLPLLSNSAATGMNVVTLANGNEVAGFTIDATNTASGIVGTGIDSFNIHDVTVQNSVDGIRIISDTTPNLGMATDNIGILANNTIIGNGFNSNRGIALTHTAGNLNLLVSGNTVSGVLGEDANNNGILGLDEDNNGNNVLDDGVGIEIVATGGTIFADDILSMTDPRGIIDNVIAAGADPDNPVSGNGTGMRLEAQGDAVFNAAVIRNTINDSTNDETAGFVALAQNGGQINIGAAFNNLINNNAGDGVLFEARNGGRLRIPRAEDANNNGMLDPGEDVNGNGELDPGEDLDEDGILDPPEDINNNGELEFGFFNNTISGNAINGIRVLADNAIADVSIGSFLPDSNLRIGNAITNNGRVITVANEVSCIGNGVLLTTLNGGTVTGRVDGNDITGNIESGINIAPNAGVVSLDSISGNTIRRNGFDSLNGGAAIPAECNAGDAIVYAPSNGGRFSVGQFTGNTIEENRGAIIRVGGDGGIVDLGVIEGTVFDRRVAGTAGILFDATNATITGILRENVFIGSDTNTDLTFGVGGEIRGGSINLTFEDNLFDTNAGAGIGLILSSSDDRPTPGTGTPIVGDAATGRFTITGNVFRNTLTGVDPRFDGAGISLQAQGYENNSLLNQNDIDDDGTPDAPLIPTPDGSDVTTNIQPGAMLTAVISENIIGDLNDNTLGNAGPGIDIRASGDAHITSMTIGAD
ncbi:MAG: hypothetical protein KDA80_09800, partial [Planctomycetaceae bacterium]|nr:hypothetical protein [Planctomycetaceae bacterium]